MVSTYFQAKEYKLPSMDQQHFSPDWVILNNLALLSFIYIDILIGEAFLILLFCPNVTSNSWGNYLTFLVKFFLAIANVVQVLSFAADFNLFSCVFVSLTPTSP